MPSNTSERLDRIEAACAELADQQARMKEISWRRTPNLAAIVRAVRDRGDEPTVAEPFVRPAHTQFEHPVH